ncbi:Glycosyl transferase protein [Pseudomonas coronafaciens pv. garcae]|nr:Glycosyl transferase protein [Pseudomonas coronafaciens pv. garcae]
MAVGLSWNGALGGAELGASLIALAPALLGMMLGQWLRQRISAALFKRVFFIGMGLLGEYLGRMYSDVRARPRFFIEKVVRSSSPTATEHVDSSATPLLNKVAP